MSWDHPWKAESFNIIFILWSHKCNWILCYHILKTSKPWWVRILAWLPWSSGSNYVMKDHWKLEKAFFDNTKVFVDQYIRLIDNFMVLVDASCTWSYICLLSTCNVLFSRLLMQIIMLRAYFLDYSIKSIMNQGWVPNLVFFQTINRYELDICAYFGCVMYVLVAQPKKTKIGPQCHLDISGWYNLLSIVRFIKPLMDDLFHKISELLFRWNNISIVRDT